MKVKRYDDQRRLWRYAMRAPWEASISGSQRYEEGSFRRSGRHGSYTIVGAQVIVRTGPMMLLREKRADQAAWRRRGR